VALAEAKRFVARHSLRLAYLAEAYMLADRLADAEDAAARAIRLALEHGERANHAYALRVAAEIHVRRNRLADAEAAFGAALELAKALRMRPLEAHCHRGLGEVLASIGKGGACASHREAAALLLREIGMCYWDEPALAERAPSIDSA
jgi:tetratricopeptide (TPR) repeat protein